MIIYFLLLLLLASGSAARNRNEPRKVTNLYELISLVSYRQGDDGQLSRSEDQYPELSNCEDLYYLLTTGTLPGGCTKFYHQLDLPEGEDLANLIDDLVRFMAMAQEMPAVPPDHTPDVTSVEDPLMGPEQQEGPAEAAQADNTAVSLAQPLHPQGLRVLLKQNSRPEPTLPPPPTTMIPPTTTTIPPTNTTIPPTTTTVPLTTTMTPPTTTPQGDVSAQFPEVPGGLTGNPPTTTTIPPTNTTIPPTTTTVPFTTTVTPPTTTPHGEDTSGFPELPAGLTGNLTNKVITVSVWPNFTTPTPMTPKYPKWYTDMKIPYKPPPAWAVELVKKNEKRIEEENARPTKPPVRVVTGEGAWLPAPRWNKKPTDYDLHERKVKTMGLNITQWPDKIIRINTKFVTEEQEQLLLTAMDYLNKFSCVQFIQATGVADKAHPQVIVTDEENICGSTVGFNGKAEQSMHLGDGCYTIGTLMHEMLHAAGLSHMQNVVDRDLYIKVNENNIQPSLILNYGLAQGYFGELQKLGLPYDYGSVMHYATMAGSYTGEPAITVLDKTYAFEPGQRYRLSRVDIARLNRRYQCWGHYLGDDIPGSVPYIDWYNGFLNQVFPLV